MKVLLPAGDDLQKMADVIKWGRTRSAYRNEKLIIKPKNFDVVLDFHIGKGCRDTKDIIDKLYKDDTRCRVYELMKIVNRLSSQVWDF